MYVQPHLSFIYVHLCLDLFSIEDFTESTCTVISSVKYFNECNDNTFTFHSLKGQVNIEEDLFDGFACESDEGSSFFARNLRFITTVRAMIGKTQQIVYLFKPFNRRWDQS